MRSFFSQKVFIFGVVVLSFGLEISTEARSLRCSDNPVVFDFEKTEGLDCLCETVKKAISFLKALGLPAEDCLTIKLNDDLPISGTHDLVGTYDPIKKEILILTYSKAKNSLAKSELGQSLEFSEGLWCSFAAHELAHAIIHENHMEKPPSRVAQEYIAYVTQLMVMKHEDLEIFLKTFGDVEGYSSIDEMSVTYYFLDPQRFAVKCYLHYLSLKNPAQFVDRLLKN